MRDSEFYAGMAAVAVCFDGEKLGTVSFMRAWQLWQFVFMVKNEFQWILCAHGGSILKR